MYILKYKIIKPFFIRDICSIEWSFARTINSPSLSLSLFSFFLLILRTRENTFYELYVSISLITASRPQRQ